VSLGILIPIIIIGSLLVILATMAILSRVQNGRYLLPLAKLLMKIGIIRRQMEKMSIKQLESSNPELASAMKKIKTFGEPTSPEAAQRMLRVLTPSERKAYMDAAGQETSIEEQLGDAPNRQLRRRMEHGGAGMPQRPTAPAAARPGAAGRRARKKK
jgi:hypothetical protein